jgi:broad specificity phosphatase PhoE
MSRPKVTFLIASLVSILAGKEIFTSAFSNLPFARLEKCHGHQRPLSIRYSYMRYLESIPDDIVKEARDMKPSIVNKMPDAMPETFKNKYYLLRHGQSTANIAEVISSSRSLAYSEKHGLTVLGYEQGRESAIQLLDVLQQEGVKEGDRIVFVSSPFARARQTAEACRDGLQFDEENRKRVKDMGLIVEENIQMENGLMERYFGRLDGDRIYTYSYVWPMDAINVTHTAFGVESVAAVCTRLSNVVEQLECQYEGHHIVWVSHADVLQIAQLYGANAENVGTFSSYRFRNGEVRAMKRTPDSLPHPSPLGPPQRGTSKFAESELQKSLLLSVRS